MLKRLRIKFVAIMMTIVTVMLAVIFGLIVYFTQVNYTRSSVEHMRTAVMEARIPGRPDRPRNLSPFPCFVLWHSSDGSLQYEGDENFFDLSDEELLNELLLLTKGEEGANGYINKYELRYLQMKTPDGRMCTVFMDASVETSAMQGLVRSSVIIGVFSLVIFWVMSMFLARITVKPVEQAWDQQRQFVADASHELKTPLTVITTNAELLTGTAASAEEKNRYGENILLMAKKMRGLVEGMLELARADNGSMRMNQSSFNFSELVSDALLPFEPLCYESGLALESSIEENIQIKGSSEHLRQVLEALLDNALKYSKPDSTVNVTLEKQGINCLLTVENHGEAISGEELKNIFKRFYRGDKARSESNGYGLGLAIAENIVNEHKGKIWAESRNGLNSFHVRLPL